ncbi:MAG TPA: PHP domain-containing protein, partial [Deltaproteobacteria bacterium]|nr:PHP domain-containing protein [Deltaproteobacteria bacterium]
MARDFTCDLHIHTCLSPCGDLDMHPRALVAAACARGLDIIAVCDHNSMENAGYVMKAAAGTSLTVVPGMEVTSAEEVHIVALLEDLERASTLQDLVYAHLFGLNDEDVFGVQAVVNEYGEVEGLNPRLLIGATTLSLDRLVQAVHDMNGLAIASHIDREAFGIIGQLGFIPPEVRFDALEISAAMDMASARKRYPELAGYPFVSSSDAHYLADIGRGVTRLKMEA